MSGPTELQTIPHVQFLAKVIEADPELADLVVIGNHGHLLAVANKGVLTVSLDRFVGVAEIDPEFKGVAHFRGPSLPPFGSAGTFEVAFSKTTCIFTVKSRTQDILFDWEGGGIALGMPPCAKGHWHRRG
ncbi:hypothetical protein EUX98_g5544 [Antrodiella citrinella]|uniref:Uncharacterized protein n=1 Tax=Antrodiella citrinella TaxID=2447956 RepID=A0A4S4MRH1_9APHY|nr:hypothetical protein EUX98_g5544 [Antrodiella citrinella]